MRGEHNTQPPLLHFKFVLLKILLPGPSSWLLHLDQILSFLPTLRPSAVLALA